MQVKNPTSGIGIHLALSAVLGLAFLLALLGFSRTAPTGRAVWISAAVALTGIWAVNFLWILPALNPAFVTLMPYAVTLASKVLFGIAMAGVLLRVRAWQPARQYGSSIRD